MNTSKNNRFIILTATIIIVAILNIYFLSLVTTTLVKAEYIAVRQNANTDSVIQQLVKKDSKVTILKKEKNWVHIFYDNTQGWIQEEDLYADQVNVTHSGSTMSVAKENVSVFKDPRSTDKEIGKLDRQATYLKFFDKNDWSQILYQNELAWVESSALKETTQQSAESNQVTSKIKANNYPARNIIKATDPTSLLASPGPSGALENIYKGEFLYVKDKEAQNGYYSATSSSNIDGYINASKAKFFENVAQRVGTKSKTLNGATIVLDPGHGGTDGGAVSNISENINERILALKTAEVLKTLLEESGAKVIMTRTSDVDVTLEKRSEIANTAQADVFISLHYDSADVKGPSGTTVHYFHYEDMRLADLVNEQFENLPLKTNGVKLSVYQVLYDNKVPSLLLELGYMNNDNDVKIFNTEDYRQKVATDVVNALKVYFDNQ
ncbi:SH3 domain-containing protein [Granulicatella sp. zg-ZJ]|uniref:N-acetylmuramoyl-L-alanine amidase n=1 Tax=Granulicatella sp. zg-ZJ TaxID=2678504 RepID=UPI0013D4169E|nr:N-acetylmuramoyl-L-alanine amidase [Granulicatella sp. zg-ZJ]NEW62462.1 SH3 domain-containing protein [Granulicatella sp. zg-ZJ]NEW63008.1 SH3 domain-containing protein [Granulicatella sp. zg-ZJ]